MAIDTSATIVLIGYVAFTLFGVVGNALTLLVLRQLREKLGKALDSITWQLMFNMALCDMVFCVIASVMVAWNRVAENGWPFSMPFVCYYLMVIADFNNVSILHMFLIALLRFAAVFLPELYKRGVSQKKRVFRLTLYVSPWFFGTIESITSYLAGYYRVRYVPLIHGCFQVPILENDLAGQQVLDRLRGWTVIMYLGVPFGVGGLLYLAILFKLWLRRRAREAKFKLISARFPGAHLDTVGSVQERQYKAVLIIAWSMAIQTIFVLPAVVGYFAIGLSEMNVDLHLVFGFYCCAYVMMPIVYAASSQEMRGSYTYFLGKLRMHNKVSFGVCTSNDSALPNTSVTPATKTAASTATTTNFASTTVAVIKIV